MYQLGIRKQNHRRLRRSVRAGMSLLVFAMLVFVCYELLHLQVKPAASIRNAPSHVTDFKTVTAKTDINEPFFTAELPAGWKAFNPTTDTTPPTYSFRSNGEQIQILSMYIDKIPSQLGVNRVVVANPQGVGLSHGSVSDNCTDFTNPTQAEKNSGTASGKWQGTSFLCDIGNYERNVVGITSTYGINEVQLTGPKSGTHNVFITYTDNSVNPDFSTFYVILDSIKFK